MPYNPESGQATAAFLNIKRRKGLEAAKQFGRKHAADLSAAAQARSARRYKPRKDRDAQGE